MGISRRLEVGLKACVGCFAGRRVAHMGSNTKVSKNSRTISMATVTIVVALGGQEKGECLSSTTVGKDWRGRKKHKDSYCRIQLGASQRKVVRLERQGSNPKCLSVRAGLSVRICTSQYQRASVPSLQAFPRYSTLPHMPWVMYLGSCILGMRP